jgi:hypothetical protein
MVTLNTSLVEKGWNPIPKDKADFDGIMKFPLEKKSSP